MVAAFWHGFFLAFGLILPLGMQNIFVFTQGAQHERICSWLPVVIMASLCDTLLILLAVGGVSVAVLTVPWLKALLVGSGVLFLLYMGWLTWKSQTVSNDQKQYNGWTLRRQLLFTMSVSLLNPHAVLDTIGVIGVSSLVYATKEKAAFALACVAVSWIWFFALALTGRLLRQKDASGNMRIWFNRFAAIIMWLSAAYLLISI